jgi:LAO/AO transport system ATPase
VLDDLLRRIESRDRLALAKLLSLVARGENVSAIRLGLRPPAQPCRVVAVTGSAGVGKSTLVGKLIDHIRTNQLSVAVLACDPQSPLSGGALLGDRFRMANRPTDDGVFIRSLAAVGGEGALARHLDTMIRAVEAFGFDVVLIETVGAGQGDTAVRDLADVVVLLLQPETGDDLQWEKAGVLEIADIVVVHKGDLPGAENVEAQVRATLELSAGSEIPVLRVSAKTGEGLAHLWSLIESQPLRRAHVVNARTLLRVMLDQVAERFTQSQRQADPVVADWVSKAQRAETTPDAAAAAILAHLLAKCER